MSPSLNKKNLPLHSESEKQACVYRHLSLSSHLG
nr:MAG TPA: hypothetical protein [Caudoviricetes sp.]